MTQKTAFYYAEIRQGGNRFVTASIALYTRRELTAFINQVLDQVQFSQRSRRQVSIPFIWRWIQCNGSQAGGSFEIESGVAGWDGITRFIGMTESQFLTAYI